MIRKLLYALRSGLFDPAVVPVVVGELVIMSLVVIGLMKPRYPQIRLGS